MRDYTDLDERLRRSAESYFRMYVLTMHHSELTVIGHLSERDWSQVQTRVRAAFAI